jgi:hypothetical protein
LGKKESLMAAAKQAAAPEFDDEEIESWEDSGLPFWK